MCDRAGTTLYLPVFNEGALFFSGDGHAVQGDGEVCITALETSVTGMFRLTVRKDMAIKRPFAENATHLMSIGLDEDLDDPAKQAAREMIKHVCNGLNLSRWVGQEMTGEQSRALKVGDRVQWDNVACWAHKRHQTTAEGYRRNDFCRAWNAIIASELSVRRTVPNPGSPD